MYYLQGPYLLLQAYHYQKNVFIQKVAKCFTTFMFIS